MLRHSIDTQSNINFVDTVQGETLEMKVTRIMESGEPIRDGAPLMYNDRADGVNADTNIRTDRWDSAYEAADVIQKSKIAKRMGDANLGKTQETATNSSSDTTA